MLPKLMIRQTFGALSIESSPSRLVTRQARMKMDVDATPATFEPTTKLPQVQIDQTESFASAGLKPILRMSSDFYDASLQKGIEAIGQIASESLQFLHIENKQNPIPEMARQRMEQDANVSLTITAMPSQRPKIDFTASDFQLNWSPSSLNIDWEYVEDRQADFTPSEVNITWLQRPHIEITLDPGTEFQFPVTSSVGANLDEAT